MKYLVIVMSLWCLASPTLAETTAVPETPSERINRFRAVLDFCRTDPGLTAAAMNAQLALDDLETLLAQALKVAVDNRLVMTSLEPYGPTRIITVPHGTGTMTKIVSDQWRLTLRVGLGWARLDDGLANPNWFARLDRTLENFENSLLAEQVELERQSWLEPNGGGTLLVLYERASRLRCEANLAEQIIVLAGQPGSEQGLIIEDRVLTQLLEVLGQYQITAASDFHSALLDRTKITTVK